jgi:hypothetical protein
MPFEQKYCIGTNDGKHQLFWDISALINDLMNVDFPIISYNVSHLTKLNSFNGNTEYAMKTDIEMPCIVVKLNENIEKLIDGNHRLYKAKQLNIENIPCYILPVKYHTKFIINYDNAVYEQVVSSFTK